MSASAATSARKRRANLTLDLDHANGDDNSAGEPSVDKLLSRGPLLQTNYESSVAAEMDAAGELEARWSVGFVVTYGAFFFAGAASIAMWSAITLCLDFFAAKYPTDRVGFVFPVVNMSSVLVISLYMVLAGRQLPLEPRVHGSLALYLVFVVMLPLVNMLDMNRHLAYTLTLVALVGSTICSSVLQSTTYGLGGVFGPIFIQALDGGKGFGAMLLFAFRLAFKWYFESADYDPALGDDGYSAKLSMAIFFGVAFWMVIMTWGLYIAMTYTAYAQPMMKEYHFIQDEAPFASPVFSPVATPLTGSPRRLFRFPSATATERSPLLMQRSSIEWDSEASTIERVGREVSMARSTEADIIDEEDDLEAPPGEDRDDLQKPRSPPPFCPTPLEEESPPFPSSSSSSVAILDVFRVAAKPFFTLFLSFFVCLSCFPGIISAIPSTSWQLGDWFPILLVGCFNTGDLVGKNLPVRVMYFDVTTLHLPWALQLSFVPFFLAALVHPFSDLVVIVATLALGLVTGYVATSSMILAPSVCNEYQKEAAGMIGSLCAIIGLCAGSYNGLALETLVQIWKEL